MKTLDEKIAVMTAYKNGARIEACANNTSIWLLSDEPTWDWYSCDYRVAIHTPKVVAPREFALVNEPGHRVWCLGKWGTVPSSLHTAEVIHVREVLPPDPNAVDLMVEVLPDGTQRIVMPMYLKGLDDLGRTYGFVRVAS